MLQFLHFLQRKGEAKEGFIISTINYFPFVFAIGFENLFKFFYYKWVYQSEEIPSNFLLKDIVLSDSVKSLYEKIVNIPSRASRHTFIIDQRIYFYFIQEIQYEYQKGLLLAEDVELIKVDLLRQINHFERLTQTATGNFSDRCIIFLSALDVESCVTYTKFDNEEMSSLWLTALAPITTADPILCQMNFNWLESLKKSSMLITKSNELQQASFFEKQRNYVNAIKL